jgi:translation initiation factor 2 gamma subunit (eIF-2gamma)
MKSSDHNGRLVGGTLIKGGLSVQHAYDLHPQGHVDHANEEITFSNVVSAGHK